MTRRKIKKIKIIIIAIALVLWTSVLPGLVGISVVIGVSSLALLVVAVVNVSSIMDSKTTYIEALFERGDII